MYIPTPNYFITSQFFHFLKWVMYVRKIYSANQPLNETHPILFTMLSVSSRKY